MNYSYRVVLVLLGVLLAFVSATQVEQVPFNRPAPFGNNVQPAQPPVPQQNSPWNFRSWVDRFRRRGNNADCKWTDPVSGNTFDFSSLHKSVGDYQGEDLTYKYALNFCGPANAGGVCTAKNAAICQFSKLTNNFISALGSFSNVPKPTFSALDNNISKGVVMTMKNGDICWMNHRQVPRTVNLRLECAPTDDTTFSVQEVFGQCTHNITFRTRSACVGAASGMSFKGFLFLMIVLAAVYVAADCYYNVKFNNMEWGKMETIPQWAFWQQVPGYTKAGMLWAYTKAYDKYHEWKTGETAKYERISTEEEDDLEKASTKVDYDDL